MVHKILTLNSKNDLCTTELPQLTHNTLHADAAKLAISINTTPPLPHCQFTQEIKNSSSQQAVIYMVRETMYRGMKPAMVDMQAQTVTVPLSVYLDLCNKHRRNDKADEYLMYVYKVRRCTRTRPHDWTECPYAHREEKARRRDPTKYPYFGVACPDFRTGECQKGQNCEYAHGVFEFWLHPSRFRTRPCESGLLCTRRICFFAHTQEQLRTEGVHHCSRCGNRGHLSNAAAMPVHAEGRGAGRVQAAMAVAKAEPLAVAAPIAPPAAAAPSTSGGRALVNPVDANYTDYPHLGLIVDLVNW